MFHVHSHIYPTIYFCSLTYSFVSRLFTFLAYFFYFYFVSSYNEQDVEPRTMTTVLGHTLSVHFRLLWFSYFLFMYLITKLHMSGSPIMAFPTTTSLFSFFDDDKDDAGHHWLSICFIPSVGVQDRPPQNVPLWRGSYFELMAIKTLQGHGKLLPLP